MKLAQLLEALPPKPLDDLAFPRHLLGAFRRKSITFCTGTTDEATVVYWFQSRSFTIDLRLPDAAATPLLDRQGWIGDTLWDEDAQELSWKIAHSYQPRNQWPEPARLAFVGNSVIEFAPSGAYVEDWRQQAGTGPFLGLRLVEMRNEVTAEAVRMDGGLVLAGEHAAYAQSRGPCVHEALRRFDSLDEALEGQHVTEAEIESYEVSVAIGGEAITYSTQRGRMGEPIASGDFALSPDGSVIMRKMVGAALLAHCGSRWIITCPHSRSMHELASLRRRWSGWRGSAATSAATPRCRAEPGCAAGR